MCGIIGYIGGKSCSSIIMDGLQRLEYRGYDSAGISYVDSKSQRLNFLKEVGNVSVLKKLVEKTNIKSLCGVGHTRWATNGVVCRENAHPHFNCTKSISVVHNGIIEGAEKIREELIRNGHTLDSSTDTEIAAHMLSGFLKKNLDLKSSLISLNKKISGAYSFVFVVEKFPDILIAMRHKSPLVLGIGKNESFVASDFIGFSDKTDTVVFMPDSSFAILKKDSIDLFDFDGKALPIHTKKVDKKFVSIDKQGFDHYMLKEIYEQKRIISKTVSFCKSIGSDKNNVFCNGKQTKENAKYNNCVWSQIGMTPESIRSLKHINLVAAGTSWHAARIVQFFFEMICRIPTKVYLASEFRYMPFFPEEKSVFIMISQSGETADTLEALRLVNSFNIPTVGITNVTSSTIVREAGGFLPIQAGPEISVAATKSFSAQLAIFYWLAHRMAYEKKLIAQRELEKSEQDLITAARTLEASIELYKQDIIKNLSEKYSKFDRFIFLGRHISYPFAMEAALKLKEISYIFSQCYPAGELKHGPIALIDEKTPVVLFSLIDDLIYKKLLSNAQEIKARKGHLVIFAFEGQDELIRLADTVFIFPSVRPLLAPVVMTGLMQFFIYQITLKLGCSIDKPRNLAKSVTVE
jgi:glutamine---fructose-6-phosphate transaminase (isomerizing)